jgi:IS30 family transposase
LKIASFDRIKNIAKALNVDKTTVYREIKRNKSITFKTLNEIIRKYLQRVANNKLSNSKLTVAFHA